MADAFGDAFAQDIGGAWTAIIWGDMDRPPL